MKIITPKESLNNFNSDNLSIFLSGGMEKPWREELIDQLIKESFEKIVVLNPTIEDWENEIGEENIENEKYVKQINWEHTALVKSDVNIFKFDGSALSPITLIEVVLNGQHDAIIFLENDYEKAAYVRILANKFNISIVETNKALLSLLQIKYYSKLSKV